MRQIGKTVQQAVWPMATKASGEFEGTCPKVSKPSRHSQTQLHCVSFHFARLAFLCSCTDSSGRCYGEHKFDPIGSVQTSGRQSVTQTRRRRPRFTLLALAPQGWKVIGCAVSAASLRYATIFSKGFFALLPCSGWLPSPIALCSMRRSLWVELAEYHGKLWRISKLHSSRKM